jgi:hypothetical protein
VKSLLQSLDATRLMILGSFIGALVMGGLVLLHQRPLLEELDQQLDSDVKLLGRTVQSKAFQLAELQRQAGREQFKGEDHAETYIRQIASHEEVQVGQVDVTPAPDLFPAPGIRDRRYSIRPPRGQDRSFRRDNLGNFLYRLEADSRRVRVTSIRISPHGRAPRPHEVTSDRWDFQFEITTREKVD